jgi:ABC-type uncharacterized transport system fused permease/ATPase subunit
LTLGVSPRPPAKVVAATARGFGLSPLLSRIGGVRGRVAGPDALSDGETLRIALARAVLSRPDLVVIDNAAFRADPEASALLSRLRGKAPATILVVSNVPLPGEVCIALEQPFREEAQ